jgi:hypothetical protein
MRKLTGVLILACVFVLPASSSSALPPEAPPLPAPSGTVVSVASVTQLQDAIATLTSGTTIVVQPGRYALTRDLWIRNVSNVALRGATNDRDDVVIVGRGMTTSGVGMVLHVSNASDVLIANLSLGEVYYHPLQLHGESNVSDVHVYNVRFFDGGEQLLKASTNRLTGVLRGLIEYSVFEYTSMGPDDGYTNGVDALLASDWVIRHNLFRNIRSSGTLTGPAVLMWVGSTGTQTYGNTFINCERAINYGISVSGIRPDHQGGSIYNNFIYREVGGTPHPDAGISVWDSPGTAVFHNTVIQNGTYPAAIEARYTSTTGVLIQNNLTDGRILLRDGSPASVVSNYTSAGWDLFVDSAAGDLHLAETATVAIDQAVPGSVVTDWDGQPRDMMPDLGADEYVEVSLPPPPPAGDVTAPTLTIRLVTKPNSVQASGTGADNVGIVGYTCALDNRLFAQLKGGSDYSCGTNSRRLERGTHSVTVVAVDAAGNTSLPATVFFTK